MQSVCWFGVINPFSTNVPLLYALKTSEHLQFSNVFTGYRIGALVENGLTSNHMFGPGDFWNKLPL